MGAPQILINPVRLMKAHRTHATVSGDSSVTLRNLPFAEGEAVEIIVIERVTEEEVADPEQAVSSEERKQTVLESGLAGLWKDRDLPDTATYARQLREQAQTRSHVKDLDLGRDAS